QSSEITRIPRRTDEARHRSLRVTDLAQVLTQRAKQERILQQTGNRVLPVANLSGVTQRMEDPASQESCAHRRHSAVEDTQKGHRLYGAGLGKLQVTLSGGVQNEKFARTIWL